MSIRSPPKFVDNILDAIAAHADAGAHAIDALIAAAHRHFAAVARLAGHGSNFNHAIGNFGNFLFEQPLHQLRSRPAQNDFHSAADFLHIEHRRPHAFVRMVRFAGNLFAARQNRLGIPQRNRGGAVFVFLHHAGDHLPHQFVILVVQGIAFGFANLLDDHLLGSLSDDAAQCFLRVELHAIVRAGNRAAHSVDVDRDIFIFAVLLFRRRYQRSFDRLEDDFLVDVLIAVDRIDDSQNFSCVHRRVRFL